MLDFFERYGLLSEHQFGFRKNYNTELAIIDIYEKLLHNLDNRLSTCAIFLDLAKAFDSVSHSILLRKLSKYGIRGKPLELLSSYIKNRSQFVCIDNVESTRKAIEFGVPQGSILGPLLFLIYINDLPKATNFFIKLYADDTYLCYQHDDLKTLNDTVNEELKKVYEWLASNRLTLNIKKSKYMIVTKKRVNFSNFSVQINGTSLERCNDYKYLGVYLDKDLNWKKHIDYLSEKISKSCGILSKLRHILELDTLREVYHALVHSYVRYGIIAWGTAAKTNLKPLQTIINRAIRLMSFAPMGNIDLQPIFEILEVLNIDQTYALEVGKFAYQDKNSLMPTRVAKFFEINRNENTRVTRQRTANIERISSNTTFGEKSIQKTILEGWENIPGEIRHSPWLKSFKRMYKSHLILIG